MTSYSPSGTSIVDVQAQAPRVQLGLSQVGVTGVEKVIRIRQNGAEQLFSARFECVVDLGPNQKGAHMSRFEEVVNDAIGEVVLGESTFKCRDARRAHRTARARSPRRASRRGHRRGPLPRAQARAGLGHSDPGAVLAPRLRDLHRARHPASGRRHRPGHDRVPMRPGIGGGAAPRATGRRGLRRRQIERIFEAVPVATHNQRGLGTLHIGCPEQCDDEIDAATLLAIVEHSMSSEIYELMKRSDEAHVVEKAHRRPRFVEDCVREMVRGVVDAVPAIDDRAFLSARQENLETIHQHNVVAERSGTFGEIRRELATRHPDARAHQPPRLARRRSLGSL